MSSCTSYDSIINLTISAISAIFRVAIAVTKKEVVTMRAEELVAETWQFNPRAMHALERAGVGLLEIFLMGEEGLKSVKGLGRVGIADIKKTLAKFGLVLPDHHCDHPIRDLGLPYGLVCRLKRREVVTVGDLLKSTEYNLRKRSLIFGEKRGFSDEEIRKIRAALEMRGLKLSHFGE